MDRAPAPEASLALTVLHEDPEVLVLDKPAGMAPHPLEAGERGTLANAIAARYPECVAASADPREAGLVHRLDLETSGCIAAARTAEAYRVLRAAFGEGRVEKRYLALVGGLPPAEGEIALPLASDPKDRRRVWPCGSQAEAERLGAQPALTRYRLLERAGPFALLEVEIVTGARHQIRAHLAAVGAPVAGDALYGGPEVAGLSRQFLHAARLAFDHPAGRGRVQAASPLPADLAAILATLRRGRV